VESIQQQRQVLIKTMLEALETPYKTLTKWEEDFVESLTDQFQRKGWLSDRQFEILERIYAEKTD
jgi:hypothetical protein